jgi:phosphopentomutase
LINGPHQDFHLINYAKSFGKITRVVCREQDMPNFGFDQSYTVNPRDDMATYIESTKHIFKSELLYLHFLDFESLYAQYGHRTPPKTLLEKIVRRTDNWIKVLLRQARKDTLFIIVGNHGRHPIPLNYEGKLAEWRKANAPIAIMFQKRTD